MQVSIETTGGVERRMTIVVLSETFERRVREKLEETARRARLDGFRPGKVPLKEIRRRFGKAVRQEVAGELMQSSFLEAVRQEELAPAGNPELEVVSMEPDADFEFTATFEIFPSIELAPFAEVAVTRPTAEIGEAEVDAMIEQLREQRKSWEPVERESRQGDRVTIDFVGRIDGQVFEGGTGEDVPVQLGEGRMLEDLERGLEGVRTGQELSIDVAFPEDFGNETLKGRTARFDVTVKEVAEGRLPELDDEFFAAYGIESGGLEAFRAELARSMERELEDAVHEQVKRQVMTELDRLHEVQLPETVVQREIESLRERMVRQMGGQADQLPNIPDDLFRDEARHRVKIGLIINEIVEQLQLEAPPERLRERIEQLARNHPQPRQAIEAIYGNEQQLRQVEMSVLEDEVIDRVVREAQVSELPSSYERIKAGEALPQSSDDAGDGGDGGDEEDVKRYGSGDTPAAGAER